MSTTAPPTPRMSPEVRQRFDDLKAKHSACVNAAVADGRSLEDAHALCSHIEREMTTLTTAMDFLPDPET